MNILVSACLLGVNCRYDGTGTLNKILKEIIEDFNFIPVCPEQLGGMSTPREPSEIVGDELVSRLGKDVTHNFVRGAQETLQLAQLYDCQYAILKERSPSCGYGQIYDGTFTGSLTPGKGVTAKLLAGHNIKIIGESKIKQLFEEVVSAGVGELTKKQAEGYGYIKP